MENKGLLMNYQAAAEYLSVSERQVRELWAKRKLLAVNIGRSVRFRPCDLDDDAERQLAPARC